MPFGWDADDDALPGLGGGPPDLAWQHRWLRRFLLTIDPQTRLQILAAAGLNPDRMDPATPTRLSKVRSAIDAHGLTPRADEFMAARRGPPRDVVTPARRPR